MPIRVLEPLLVNQIAAGEVIERPASVVKELIENSIDAGASRIDVAIEQGGKELIRVTDDGSGIGAGELELALAAHATSKIATAEDLDAIATMGFRGEALASIASVSRISILSRTRDQDGALVIEGEGAAMRPPRPAGGPVGTSVTVRNLFFNTPARRKFLRTDRTEAGRVVETVQGLALAHPAVGFSLTMEGQVRLELPPEQSPRQRVLAVLGEELAGELLEVTSDDRGIGLWGLAGTPHVARATARHLRVFLNGRLIADRSINHAIKEAYRGLIEPTRSPTIALYLEMDPALVDVNVHPAKAEVRFRNQGAVHGAVLSAVREALRKADLTPQFDLQRTGSLAGALATPPAAAPEFASGMGGDATRSGAAPAPGAFVDYFRRLDPKQKGFVYSEVKEALAREAPEILQSVSEAEQESEAAVEALPTVRGLTDALQVHSSFIVTQDEHGLVIVDQHALHERVMFETMRQRLENGSLEAQRLLMPETFEADRAQVEALERLQPLLAKLGIEAELMGPNMIGVHAFTSLLFARNVEPIPFLQELLGKAADEKLGDDPEAALHEVLDMMACKAAIKAGDRLEPGEIADLLKHRESVERSSSCPHGRPTSLRLTIRDLEKQFGRR
jgi:DNA mismatch repair protein MutL